MSVMITASYSQEKPKYSLKYFSTHIQQTLKSQSNELILASFISVIQVAQRYGLNQVNDIKSSIVELSYTHPNSEIRLKAFLTSEALNNESLLKSLPEASAEKFAIVYLSIENSINNTALITP